MFFNPEITVWLCKDRLDMRKSINGLSIAVASNMNKNPSSGEIFLFFGKHSDRVKILYWDRNGFCLYYKRLEKGKFKIPVDNPSISYEQLSWLLAGLDISNLQGHQKLSYKHFF